MISIDIELQEVIDFCGTLYKQPPNRVANFGIKQFWTILNSGHNIREIIDRLLAKYQIYENQITFDDNSKISSLLGNSPTAEECVAVCVWMLKKYYESKVNIGTRIYLQTVGLRERDREHDEVRNYRSEWTN